MKYAVLNAQGTAVREVREYAVLPPTRPGMVRPLVSTPVPPHNQRTHQAALGYSIAPTQVTETWTVTQRPSILPTTWTPLEFLGRFTTQEMDQIESRQAADPIVRSFYRAAAFATEIVSDDPRTVAGMDYLQSSGILTAARKAAILDGP